MRGLLLTTGGTIGAEPYPDPANPPIDSTMPTDGRDIVREYIEATPEFSGVLCVSLEHRDSKFIDEPYRQNMLATINRAEENKVVVTHGTDRILQSAEWFYQKRAVGELVSDKTVLLTGSMTPLSNGPESDGYKNLHAAFKWLRHGDLQPDIYIVLCDYANGDAETGAWEPKLYPYLPNKYEKVYTRDGRYNRLRTIAP